MISVPNGGQRPAPDHRTQPAPPPVAGVAPAGADWENRRVVISAITVSLRDILAPVLGLLAGVGLATLKYALEQRARLHEDLWSRRLDAYREAWRLTSQFSRWPEQHPTIGDVERLHEQFRQWFYRDGGILMSARARKRYTYVQEGLAALCKKGGHDEKLVCKHDYKEISEIFSGFRAALTGDLESRRKRSMIWSIVDLLKDRKAHRKLSSRLKRLRA